MGEHFGKIKKDSVIKVYNTVLDRVRSTRTELSSLTGLSYVTVSKICDGLLSLDILKQSFTTDRSAIRRSRVISVKSKYWIGIYTFEPELFTFNICDLSLRIIHTFNYIPANDIFVDDTVNRFIKCAENFAKQKARNRICCGTGILVPGEYNYESDTVQASSIPHFNSIYLKKLFQGKTFDTLPTISSLYTSYSREIQKTLEKEDKILALYLNKGDLKCTYFDNHTSNNIHLNNMGILPCGDNSKKSLNVLCETPPDPSILFPRLADIIFTLMNTVKITKVTLNGNLYTRMDAAESVLKNNLHLICDQYSIIPPNINTINVRAYAIKNIAREIRNIWFTEKILEEDSL